MMVPRIVSNQATWSMGGYQNWVPGPQDGELDQSTRCMSGYQNGVVCKVIVYHDQATLSMGGYQNWTRVNNCTGTDQATRTKVVNEIQVEEAIVNKPPHTWVVVRNTAICAIQT